MHVRQLCCNSASPKQKLLNSHIRHSQKDLFSESFSGSVDLFSMARSGAGWVEKITAALTSHCGGSWSLNSHTYERETGLFHWEWTFEVMR